MHQHDWSKQLTNFLINRAAKAGSDGESFQQMTDTLLAVRDPRRAGNVIRKDKRRDPYIPGWPIIKRIYDKYSEKIIKIHYYNVGNPVCLISEPAKLPFLESLLFGRRNDPENTLVACRGTTKL